jgi:signal transduction histidine kinase
MSGVALASEIVEGRKQRTFVDSVTHELKSPLASIGLCLETLSRSDLTDAQRADLRAMMRHDVQRLSAFIDDVLIASRLAHDRRVEARVSMVRVGDVVRNAVEHAQQRHQTLDALSIEGDPDLTIPTDATALETILRNLFDNALKYSPPGEKVRVRFGLEGKNMLLEVTDKGIGIAADDLPRVFRRFYRGDSEDVRARSGTGLGLYVASELAAAMGGSLAVRSDGPGQGATFTLLLPHHPGTPR